MISNPSKTILSKNFFPMVAALFFSAPLWAQFFPVRQLTLNPPEGTELRFVGHEPCRKTSCRPEELKSCALFIGERVFKEEGGKRILVSAQALTQFQHGHAHPPITVTLTSGPEAGKESIYSGKQNGNRDEIAIFLPAGETDLEKATRLNLRWQHGNHPHTDRCLNLRLQEPSSGS